MVGPLKKFLKDQLRTSDWHGLHVLFGAQEGARSYSLVPGFGGVEIDESNTAVAFARYGEGTVSYFGDVNHEQETLEIMSVIAMGN